MSVFNYTLPSGAQFTVRGPSGATQALADRIFYEQVAAGSLIDYQPGQTLSGVATQITKFELSRLDRGTAGVDIFPVLSIVQGLSLSSSDLTTQSVLAAIQALPIPVSVPNLGQIPLSRPIDEADIVLIKGDDLSPNNVGDLSEYQVQKLLAQIANLVDQESDQISRNKGIGQFGMTAYQLEQTGYVKPGTSLRFFAIDPENFVDVMSSPSVWTGKNGVYSLDDILGNAELQNKVQVQLMQQGYDELLSTGTIYKAPSSSIKLSTGQVFTNGALQSIQTLNTLSLLAGNRGSVSVAVQNALANNTIVKNLLSSANVNLSTIGSGAVNSLKAGLSNLGSLSELSVASVTSTISQQLTGGVGALVANASKFGSQATALWAKAGTLDLNNIGSSISGFASGGLNNLAGSLTGNLGSITSNLTNLVPGSISNLTSSLDIFGKASSFATNFANPLASLNNLGNLGNLGGLLNAGGGIGGAITGQLGNLGNLGNLANLGNLGNLANLGNLGNLANLGNLGNLANLGNLGNLANLGNLGGLSSALGSLGSFANIGVVTDLFGGGGDLVSGTQVAAGFNNTVNRATVDAAFARIVGSSKVPLPAYQYPSPVALAPRLDIQQAFNFLKDQFRTGGETFGQTVTI